MKENEVDCVGSADVGAGVVVVVVVIVVFRVVVARENCHFPTLSGFIASGLNDCISELERIKSTLKHYGSSKS